MRKKRKTSTKLNVCIKCGCRLPYKSVVCCVTTCARCTADEVISIMKEIRDKEGIPYKGQTNECC